MEYCNNNYKIVDFIRGTRQISSKKGLFQGVLPIYGVYWQITSKHGIYKEWGGETVFEHNLGGRQFNICWFCGGQQWSLIFLFLAGSHSKAVYFYNVMSCAICCIITVNSKRKNNQKIQKNTLLKAISTAKLSLLIYSTLS